ncbi:signal peptidase II [Pedobacter montanisoli]|uniref:Lipoprotein signal peptidase n=1 Tax=Pedobacter montanisoli TaxID=2923277 RepID=A0ABS9ZVA4_9SPHI|nr:signal peptidase II [Pedobacter montanisoli]MCJ0741209.1 signal peptidase II [Pedobacter montanisoli]
MKAHKPLTLLTLIFLLCLNLGCDQVSKIVVRKNIDTYQQIVLIKDRFILTKVENTGAFLSAGSNLPDFVRTILLTILPIAVLLYGLYFLFSQKKLSRLMQIGLCFLIGGGIGNVFDRIIYGSVTDFMHMDFVLFRTGIFNMADVSIMTGIGLLLLEALLKPKATTPAQV